MAYCGVYWDLLCMKGSPVVSNASSPRTPTNGVPALGVWVVVRSHMGCPLSLTAGFIVPHSRQHVVPKEARAPRLQALKPSPLSPTPDARIVQVFQCCTVNFMSREATPASEVWFSVWGSQIPDCKELGDTSGTKHLK